MRELERERGIIVATLRKTSFVIPEVMFPSLNLGKPLYTLMYFWFFPIRYFLVIKLEALFCLIFLRCSILYKNRLNLSYFITRK